MEGSIRGNNPSHSDKKMSIPSSSIRDSRRKKCLGDDLTLCYARVMTTLPLELQDMVEHSGDTPVRVVDPRTQRVYVLIANEQFDRLRSLLDMEPLTLDQQRMALVDAGQRAGWDDPEMDVYDNYDALKPQP